jgi:hypothetical protein
MLFVFSLLHPSISIENRERILKDVREKKQITFTGKPIKITADFSMETLNQRHGVRTFRY